jgi:hypothetical protein
VHKPLTHCMGRGENQERQAQCFQASLTQHFTEYNQYQ